MPSNPHHLPALLTAQRGGQARVAVAVPILHLGKPGKGLVQGRRGTPLLHGGRSSGSCPLPIALSPGVARLFPGASLHPTRPFRCLARDLISSPLVSFSENEIGSAWAITCVRQLL